MGTVTVLKVGCGCEPQLAEASRAVSPTVSAPDACAPADCPITPLMKFIFTDVLFKSPQLFRKTRSPSAARVMTMQVEEDGKT